MATEEGIVIKSGPATAWIKTTRSGACESCASRMSCHTIGSGKEMEVEALNPVGARQGDHVVINFESSALLKISFLLYVFPVICLLAGALLGNRLGPALGFSGSAVSVLLAVFFFLLAFFIIKSRGNALAVKDAYRPKVVRIIKKKGSGAGDQGPERQKD
jgi:sigma-E factor negative regulatory protein RseC